VKQALGPAPGADPIPRLVQNPITLEALTERYIAGVLKSVGGSKTKAAEILAWTPPRSTGAKNDRRNSRKRAARASTGLPALSCRRWTWRSGMS
jgi:hypothetical protein